MAHTSAAVKQATDGTSHAIDVQKICRRDYTEVEWRKVVDRVLGDIMIPAAPPLMCEGSGYKNEGGRDLPHRCSHLPRSSLGLALSHAFRPYFNA